jgi:hypothetical protein
MTISTTYTVEGKTFSTKKEAEAYELRCEQIKEVAFLFDAVIPKKSMGSYEPRIKLNTPENVATFLVDHLDTFKEAMTSLS